MKRDRSGTIVESLIQTELSAGERCRQLAGAEGGSGASELRRVESEHRQAAAMLRRRRRGRAAAPTGAGFSPDLAGHGGPGPALRALLASEEQGIREYERALECPLLGKEYKELISSTLMPLARSHLPVLDRCLRQAVASRWEDL